MERARAGPWKQKLNSQTHSGDIGPLFSIKIWCGPLSTTCIGIPEEIRIYAPSKTTWQAYPGPKIGPVSSHIPYRTISNGVGTGYSGCPLIWDFGVLSMPSKVLRMESTWNYPGSGEKF